MGAAPPPGAPNAAEPAAGEPLDRLDRLAEQFRLFVDAECSRYTPLYARLGLEIAKDRELLGLLASAKPGQQRPVLLMAAVHDLVLGSPDVPLARFYPSITGGPVPAGDPFPAFRRLCLERRDDLLALLSTRSTQTNEVNRCVALRPALAAAVRDLPDTPVALVELGASAGLNLGFDRYCLPGRFGPPDSPVRLASEETGAAEPPFRAPLPEVAWRRGIDQSPVSLADADAVRWLEACLWPEQIERVERFRAAVRTARDDPPTVVAGDMVDALAEVADAAPPDVHMVIWHSWALTYVARDRRPALADAIASLAATGRPVTWVSAEAPGVVAAVPRPDVLPDASDELRYATLLGMERFRGGRAVGDTQLLARCHPHVRWIEWLA